MERTELPDFFKELSTLVEDAHRYAKVAGVNFFKQNFRRQGFLDTSLIPWAKRSLTIGSDRGVLIQIPKITLHPLRYDNIPALIVNLGVCQRVSLKSNAVYPSTDCMNTVAKFPALYQYATIRTDCE